MSHTDLKPTQKRVPERKAYRLLNEFGRSRFDADRNFVDRIGKMTAGSETCYRVVDRQLVAEEAVRTDTVSGTVGNPARLSDRFVDYDIDRRAEIEPEEFVDTEFRYFLPDSVETVGCPDCVGGTKTCRKCSGDGRKRCWRCQGRGALQGAENGENCPSCNGRGTHVCKHCTGGRIRCPRCDGSSRLTSYQYLVRSYRVTEDVEYVTTMDVDDLQGTIGRSIGTTPAEPSSPAVRREIETFELTVVRLNYTVDSRRYRLLVVDGEFYADDYPAVRWKTLLPYVGVGVSLLVVTLVLLYWWLL